MFILHTCQIRNFGKAINTLQKLISDICSVKPNFVESIYCLSFEVVWLSYDEHYIYL